MTLYIMTCLVWIFKPEKIFSGVSFDIKYVSDNLSVGGNVSGTDSRDESLQLGVSPLKATLNLSYLFSNNLKIELQEIYYGPRSVFGGVMESASLWNRVSLNYPLYDNLQANLMAQFNLRDGKTSNPTAQLMLQGSL